MKNKEISACLRKKLLENGDIIYHPAIIVVDLQRSLKNRTTKELLFPSILSAGSTGLTTDTRPLKALIHPPTISKCMD